VTPVNDNLPVFTSLPAFSVAEKQKAVGTVTATDADLPLQFVTFSITGGADANKFSISNAGVVEFKSPPDFGVPTEADANNVYELQVTANDGNGGLTVQNVAVTVTHVNTVPVITLSTSADTYLLNKKHSPLAIDTAATFNPGLPNPNLASAKLIVSLSANRNSSDILGLVAGTTNGLTLKGKHLVVGKTIIGTISGGKAKVPDLTIAFTSDATSDLIQKTIQKLTFSTKVTGTGPRTVQMHLTGVGGQNSNTASRQITVH
jgi:hypothetical protein